MKMSLLEIQLKQYQVLLLKTLKERFKGFYLSPFFFLTLYFILYGFHCFWNWDEFMSNNRKLEMDAISSGKQVSLWSLYPFQIVSVIFVSVMYLLLSVSIYFLFSFFKRTKETFRNKLGKFMKSLIHQFFFFVCLLFLGNQILGLFLRSNFYSTLVVVFWTTLFLFFLINNGELYKRLFVSSDQFVTFLSRCLGYLNPILFVFFVLILANV
ncbi:hypothetical protein EHQ73_02040 [Leptospira meyeri]|nr:hypothetical protein EHQ73_02040 [Leptospira meyeri]